MTLCAAVTLCHLFEPDALAFVTYWPAWCWVLPGGLLAIAGCRRARRRHLAALAGTWALFMLAFADEPLSIIRLRRSRSPDTIRVVSLNCAVGRAEAAAEAARHKPDIVLFQESPSRGTLLALARELVGDEAEVVWGVDASIVAKGIVRPAELPRELGMHMTRARVTLSGGREVDVVSVRLQPPVFPLDFWTPACWRAYAEDRRSRRKQVQEVMRCISARSTGLPLIVGGDLNCPAGDAALAPMRPRLVDAFTQAGRGWGHTALNSFPVVRVDQVWISDRLRARDVTAIRTQHSDHRMVVCDVVLRPYQLVNRGGLR